MVDTGDIVNDIYILFLFAILICGITISIIVFTNLVSSCVKLEAFVAIIFLFSIFFIFMIFKKLYYIDREKNSFFIFTSQNNFKDYYINWMDIDIIGNIPLIDYYISSAYKPYIIGGLEYDIVSINHIHKSLRDGARCHYLEIDSSNQDNMLDNTAKPIIHIPHMLKEHILFEDVCKLYKSRAWVGTKYPFILFLDFKKAVLKNKFMYEILSNIIKKYFSQNIITDKDINNINIKEALGNIIICTNIDFSIYDKKPGFSFFTEKLKSLTCGYINTDIKSGGTREYEGYDIYKNGTTFQKIDIKEYNKNNFSMIVPETINTSFTNIINPGNSIKQIPLSIDRNKKYTNTDEKNNNLNSFTPSFTEKSILNCNFTCNFIYYHYPGKNKERQEYIDFFKTCSFIKKKK